MENEQTGLHVLYKNLGETPLECILRFKKENPEYENVPITYAGRLDPMAEGVLVILSGEKVHEKEKYLNLPKTYTFEILWGVSTDTQDLLGLVVKSESACAGRKLKVASEYEIQKLLDNSKGKYRQSYPVYSSKPVLGKPLWQQAREEKLSEIEVPNHELEIFNAKYISRRILSGGDLLQYIVAKISLVSGDFRQKEIIEKWQEVLSKCLFDSYVIDTVRVEVSSGFYVRQFVSDLAKSCGTLATTFHIRRDKVGDFIL